MRDVLLGFVPLSISDRILSISLTGSRMVR